MQTIDLLTLIPRCHAGSRAKGFWDVTPPKGQQLMLVVSELAEALEADRKGRVANLPGYLVNLAEAEREGRPSWGDAETLEQRTQELFVWKIKDTVADELADAYIRLCDFAGGFGLELEDLPAEITNALDCPDNLGEALLGIAAVVCMAEYDPSESERAVGMAMAQIEALCQQRGIDLATHIDLKLAYNATRPAKHDKAY